MGLGFAARTLKFCLFIFNLIFLICGLICLGLGIWLQLDKYAVENLTTATETVKEYEKNEGLRNLASMPNAVRLIGVLLAIGGVAVIIVAFLGCCGAAKEWRPLLCCYGVCLMIILSMEIAAAIYAAVHSQAFEHDFKEIIKVSLKFYNGTDAIPNKDDKSILVKSAWDKIMIDKNCCGVNSELGEFVHSGWFNLTKGRHQFPPACCPKTIRRQLMLHCPIVLRHGDGCYLKIKDSINELSSHLAVVIWTVVVIALIQVFGIIVAFSLCDSISTSEHY